jgi:hypothetical protein
MSDLPPAHTDPDKMGPDEKRLASGSKAPNGGPWVVVILILMLGFAAFAAFAL